MKQTPEQSVATSLLVYLASGGTLDRVLSELPAFRAQLEAALQWMSSTAQCTAADVESRAERLRDLMQGKYDAVMRRDFDKAAELRAEECALFRSMGLQTPTGEAWHSVLRVGIEEQIKQLSDLLCQNGKN